MKNGKTIAAILGLGLSAAMPLAAHAQAATPGAYVGIGLGQSTTQDVQCDPLPICDKKGAAWKFYGGWQFHRNFAAEVGYTDLGRFRDGTPGVFTEEIKTRLSEATLVGSYPVTERFSVFGKVGAYYAASKYTATGSSGTQYVNRTNGGPTYGGALQYFVWTNLAVRGEFQRYRKLWGGGTLVESDVDLWTVGLLAKFK